jgi:hypothetical protein
MATYRTLLGANESRPFGAAFQSSICRGRAGRSRAGCQIAYRTNRLRVWAAQARPRKPSPIIAHVPDSGTSTEASQGWGGLHTIVANRGGADGRSQR